MRRRISSKNKMMIMSNTQWREKFMYPLLGIVLTATIIYFNVEHKFDFPVVLWQKNMGFVGVESTKFVVINGQDYGRKINGGGGDDQRSGRSTVYVNGWNSYWLLSESLWGPSREKVARMFKKGSEMGLNVCRTWAFSDGPGPNSLQVSPGVFNERVLKGLDYIIVEARKNGIRLILSLVNNLDTFGGKEQYVKWAKEAGVNVASSADPFFEDPTIKGYYKSYIKAIITRRNSLSGVKYSEEPAIFAWELINEPRCDSNSSTPILQAWITEMAAYTKSLDQKHLVTVGLEGFYGPNTGDKLEVNPGEWASFLGTDFIQNSAVNGIDFASVHAYPDNWLPHGNDTEKMNFVSKWMDSHIRDGEEILKKPVLFTEVGCPVSAKGQGAYDRDMLLKAVYDRLFESANKGQAGAGTMIWQLLVEGMENYYVDRYSLIAWKEHTTYQLILKQSCRLRHIFWKSKTTQELSKNDLCYGLLS